MKFQCNNCGNCFEQGEGLDLDCCSCHVSPPCSFCVEGDTCPNCGEMDAEEIDSEIKENSYEKATI